MTKKHFIAIAATIKAMPEPARTIAARDLATTCASTNPRFDRQRFLTACGVE